MVALLVASCLSTQRVPPSASSPAAVLQESVKARQVFNRAVAQEERGLFTEARGSYERLVRDYPRSELVPRALFRAAVNAEKSSAFEVAIAKYLALADGYPRAEDRAAALFNAARLHEGLRHSGEAAAGYLRYAREYPTNEDAPAYLLRAGLIYARQGDCPRALLALRECLHAVDGTSWQAQQEARGYFDDCSRKLADGGAR